MENALRAVRRCPSGFTTVEMCKRLKNDLSQHHGCGGQQAKGGLRGVAYGLAFPNLGAVCGFGVAPGFNVPIDSAGEQPAQREVTGEREEEAQNDDYHAKNERENFHMKTPNDGRKACL